MALPTFKTQPLIAPQQPRLLAAPMQYDAQYQEQYSNSLRLYFNQLQNFLQLFTTNTGGSLLQFPNGAFHQDGYTTLSNAIPNSSSTATIVVASTVGFASAGTILIEQELISYTGKTSTTFTGITRGVYGTTNTSHSVGANVTEALGVASSTSSSAIPLDTTDVSNGVSIDTVDDTKILFAVAGYYNIQFSAQLLNFTTTDDNVTFWWKQNGTDVAYSAGIQAVPSKHGSTAGAAIVSWNIVLPINANDYIQLYFASESGNTVTATYPAGTLPTHPVSPSVILTATFVSALFP